MKMDYLEEKLSDVCLDILSDLRPRSIVDRKKFDFLYDLLDEINIALGSKEEINRKTVNNVVWIINQLETQTHYATGEKLDALKKELGTLLYKLLDGGLFKSFD
ncbi:hypothetical protein [Brevibacillus sp. SIMBA_040]|uniref:hypothetical protein n=1 Tax=unclassified Brevibacillus TaxID=2684853 RepID=UPI0039788B22